MSNVNHSHVHIVGDCEVWHRSTVKGNGGGFDLSAIAITGGLYIRVSSMRGLNASTCLVVVGFPFPVSLCL